MAVAGLAPLLTEGQRGSQLASVVASVCDDRGDEEMHECAARWVLICCQVGADGFQVGVGVVLFTSMMFMWKMIGGRVALRGLKAVP